MLGYKSLLHSIALLTIWCRAVSILSSSDQSISTSKLRIRRTGKHAYSDFSVSTLPNSSPASMPANAVGWVYNMTLEECKLAWEEESIGKKVKNHHLSKHILDAGNG